MREYLLFSLENLLFYLNNQEYNVFKAGNGIEGLEIIGKETIHFSYCRYNDAQDGWNYNDNET